MKNQTKSNLRALLPLQMFFLILLFLVSAILISSCDTGSSKLGSETSNTGKNTPESEAASLNINRDKWRAVKYSRNYRMTIKVMQPGHEGIGGVFVITVRDGRAESIKTPNPSDPDNPDYLPRRITEYDTIEKLFGIIEKAIQRKPEKLTIKYEQSLGCPEKFDVDYTLSGNDDELSFELIELHWI